MSDTQYELDRIRDALETIAEFATQEFERNRRPEIWLEVYAAAISSGADSSEAVMRANHGVENYEHEWGEL